MFHHAPAVRSSSEHRWQQQRQQKQNVVEAGPDVPGAIVHEGEELPPPRRDSQFKLLRRLLRTEHGRLYSSAVFETQQTTVLGVDVEKRAIINLQIFRRGRAF